jgi:peptidyl-prolyl cis-trans isomerase D
MPRRLCRVPMAKDTPKIHNQKHIAHLEKVRRQERAIVIIAIIVSVLVVGLVAYGYLSSTVFLQYRTVASVNGDKITVGEFQSQVKLQRYQLINRYVQYMQFAQMFGIQDPLNDQNFGSALQQMKSQLDSTDTMGQNVLDTMIDERLIRQEAKKRGMAISKEELDKGVQEAFNYYPNGSPTPTLTATQVEMPTLGPTQLALVTITPTPSPVYTETATATATVDPLITPTQTPPATATATSGPTATVTPTSTPPPTATPYTLDGFNTRYKDTITTLTKETGFTDATYRTLVEGILLRQKLSDEVTADLKPFEEQVWARHILVATEDEAKNVLTRLKAGEDWSKIAAKVSTDTSNKDKGGDLGWFARGAMVTEFENAAFSMVAGQVSQPVKTSFGYHIIQVLGHEDRPLTAVDFQTYKDKFFTDFLKKLRDDGKVETYDLWKTVVPTEPAMPAGVQ